MTNYTINDHYSEPHRHYHNWDHIKTMLNKLSYFVTDNNMSIEDDFVITQAVIYHDVIYDPRRSDNEEKSIEFMRNILKSTHSPVIIDRIAKLIRATIPGTYVDCSNDKLVKLIRYLDCRMLYEGDLNQMIKNFKLLLKEYQFVDYNVFLAAHLSFIDRFYPLAGANQNLCRIYKDYVLSYRPKIGIYAGSFNPFHVGHISVLEQAERIFDKVIIITPNTVMDNAVYADNKHPRMDDLHAILPFHEVINFKGLLTDFVHDNLMSIINADFTLIRGMRNGNDLEYEVNLNKAYDDLGARMNIVYFMTDKPHVSSSMVREIKSVSENYKVYIPTKYDYAGSVE